MLFSATILPLLAAVAYCIPTARQTGYQYYGLKASSNDTKINGQVINAAEGVFWINRPTGRFCGQTTKCATEPDTYITFNSTNALLNPYIPQYAYVSEYGDFFFSEDGVPQDADEPTLYLSTFAISGGKFTFSEAPVWLACPAGNNFDASHQGPYYHIFAKIAGLTDRSVSGGSIAACSEFMMTASVYPAGTTPLHYN